MDAEGDGSMAHVGVLPTGFWVLRGLPFRALVSFVWVRGLAAGFLG